MGNCSEFHNFHTSNKRQTKLRIARDDDDAGKVVVKGKRQGRGAVVWKQSSTTKSNSVQVNKV